MCDVDYGFAPAVTTLDCDQANVNAGRIAERFGSQV